MNKIEDEELEEILYVIIKKYQNQMQKTIKEGVKMLKTRLKI